MSDLLNWLARVDGWRRITPRFVVGAGRRLLPLRHYNRQLWARQNPFVGTAFELEYRGSSRTTLGIVFDPAHYHQYHQQACQDMDVSYRVLDLFANDWMERVERSGCDALLVWPHLWASELKDVLDERLWLASTGLGLEVFPSWDAIWLLDNKRRVRDWLASRRIAHPRTWCFVDREEAMDFATSCELPVVFKSLRGSISLGVEICRRRRDVRRLVRTCFGLGFHRPRSDPRDRQRNQVVFQEYLGAVEEHRVVRVAESYLYVRKVRKGDFHSGSGTMEWARPDRKLLDLARTVTAVGGFTTMDVDVFETADGRLLVNELHALFHGPRVPDNAHMGRFLYDSDADRWEFEPGNFYRGYCSNLRVAALLDRLGDRQAKGRCSWADLPVW